MFTPLQIPTDQIYGSELAISFNRKQITAVAFHDIEKALDKLYASKLQKHTITLQTPINRRLSPRSKISAVLSKKFQFFSQGN